MQKRPIDENYSRNQCALVLRMDGEEMYIPLDFGRSLDEVRAIYPYLLEMFQSRIANPAVKFQADVAAGKYEGMPKEEYYAKLELMKKASMLFYNRAEENLLTVAIRFAVDMKLRGVDELYWLFETVAPPERINAKALRPDEAERVLDEHRMVHPVEREFDAGDEVDVAPGIGGGLGVDIYGEGTDKDPFSTVLDELEAAQPLGADRFEEAISGDADPGKYKSGYEKGKALPEKDVKGGLLHIYDEGTSGVFDELDRLDGLQGGDAGMDGGFDAPEPDGDTQDGDDMDDTSGDGGTDDAVDFGSVSEEDDSDDFEDSGDYVFTPPEGDDEDEEDEE